MQPDDLSHVWIGTAEGELVRADMIAGLRCAGGSADAYCSDGRMVRLAGSGCPADFHVRLLGELARARGDSRWFVIIAAELSRDGARWAVRRTDDLIDLGSEPGSRLPEGDPGRPW
jgi:hypothetical protein